MSGTGIDWHVTPAAAARYVAGTLPEPDAWSVERHVEQCAECGVRISRLAAAGPAARPLADVRSALLAAVDAPAEARPPHRRAVGTARLFWSVGPALRGPWLVAVLTVAVAAAVLAYGTGFDGARPLLLALAPVLPVAGVAASYGRHADPLHEITASAPSGGLRLLLVRTSVVLAVSLPLLTAAGAVLPPAGMPTPGAAAWLLPGLTLTLAALALGTYTGCRTATALVGCGWAAAVAAPVALPSPGPASVRLAEQLSLYLDGPAARTGWAAALVLCAGAVAARRASYDLMETS